MAVKKEAPKKKVAAPKPAKPKAPASKQVKLGGGGPSTPARSVPDNPYLVESLRKQKGADWSGMVSDQITVRDTSTAAKPTPEQLRLARKTVSQLEAKQKKGTLSSKDQAKWHDARFILNMESMWQKKNG